MSDDCPACGRPQQQRIVLVTDPNDGAAAVFVDGKKVYDTGDSDLMGDDSLFMELFEAIVDQIGGVFVEESRYRPSRQDSFAAMEGFIEYDSYWPESIDGMGPVEEPLTEPDGELTAEELDPQAPWNDTDSPF